MQILLDNIIYSKTKHGGVSNYWYELSKYLLNESNCDITFFEDQKASSNFHRMSLQIPPEKLISLKIYSEYLSRLMPINYQSDNQFIYHSSYYRGLSGSKNKIEVTTVYDFIHSYYMPFANKIIHNNLKFNAIKRSKGIVCISKNTYDDLQKFCPTKSHQKIEVIHVGVSDDYFPIELHSDEQLLYLQNLHIEPGYLLFVGGRTSYKNFDFVVRTINENKKLKLVIVGGGQLTEIEQKIFTAEAIQRTTHISNASNNELNVLLNNALALLYPSSYEGFGIPVVEALRAGCPVIGLNNATIKEVAENCAILLDTLSISEISKKIENLDNNNFRQATIAQGLADSKKYSWEKCSRETAEFYRLLF